MNNFPRVLRASTIALAIASVGAYADPGKTREQVKAELAAAHKAGDVIIGDGGLTAREMFPSEYPPVAAGPGKTREQVRAELAAAMRAGNVVVRFQGLTPRQRFPDRYAGTEAPRDMAHTVTAGGPAVRW